MSCFRQITLSLVCALALIGIPLSRAVAQATVEEEEYVTRVVEVLTQPAYEGRAGGTLGSRLAAGYLATELARLGVLPLGSDSPGDADAYFSYFRYTYQDESGEEREAVGRNVVGWISGTKAGLGDGYYLLSAHYDHLGYRMTAEGWKYYPGAADNASGVAAVLALARRFTLLGRRPAFPIVIALFDGEERGLKGSRAFVEDPPLPLKGAFNINFDIVGTMTNHRLLVAASASKSGAPNGEGAFWNDLQAVAGELAQPLLLERMRQGWQAGDHYSFYRAKVPFVYLFTGMGGDYDRVTDTPDKLNFVGIVEVASFVTRLMEVMDPPESYRWRKLEEEGSSAARGARKAYLGTIPDFTRQVEGGVALKGVERGSPAEVAGIRGGDILREIDGMAIESLRAFAEVLPSLKPGQIITVTVERDGSLISLQLKVGERPTE